MRSFALLLVAFGVVRAQMPAPPVVSPRPIYGAVAGQLYFAEDKNPPARFIDVWLQPADTPPQKPPRSRARTPYRQDSHRTGPDGSFRFEDVTPGTYFVIAEAVGFPSPMEAFDPMQVVDQNQMQSDIIAKWIPKVTVTAGNTATVKLYLWRQGSISGQVRFDDGTNFHPSNRQRLDVDMLEPRFVKPGSAYLPPQKFPLDLDEDGRFHASGLFPGRYRLSLRLEQRSQGHQALAAARSTSSAPIESYSLTLYSGDTFDPDQAAIVELKSGQQVDSVLLTVPALRFRRLSGAVLTAAGDPFGGCCQVSLLLRAGDREVASAHLDAMGEFVFPYLPIGDYELRIANPIQRSVRPGESFTVAPRSCDVRLPVRLEANLNLAIVVHPPPCTP